MRKPGRDLARLRRRLTERPAEPPPAPRKPVARQDTWIELAVAAMLDRLGLVYERQHRLLGVSVDFFLPVQGAVVECQGTYFHADPTIYGRGRLTAEQRRKRARDAALRLGLERSGLVLIELWEEELRERPEWCGRWLAVRLGLAPPESLMSERRMSHTTPAGVVLAIHHGDLTTEDTDAIVNAANSHLAHGGGVAGAIVRRGGAVIQRESDDYVRRHGAVPTGQVALTGPGALACRAVIHAVGPVWRDGQDEPRLLREAVTNALELAHEQGLTSLALPAISSGIFGFPKPLCAEILVDAALAFAHAHPDTPLREIRFTNFDAETVGIFEAEFRKRGWG